MGVCNGSYNRRKVKNIREDFLNDPNSINYDMILNFYSFQQLKKDGWTCYFTPEGKKNMINVYKNIIL